MEPESRRAKRSGSGNAAAMKDKRKKRKKRIKKFFISLLVLLILAGAGVLAYARLRQEYTVTYQEYTASTGTISNSLSFSGTLQLINSAAYTASSSATVRSVSVKAGQDVKAGEELVRLSNGQTLQAEFDGRVNQLYAVEGEKVSSGAELVQVVDFEHMKVSIRVDEYDISDVHVGDACRVTTTATENVFDSSISDINYVSSSTGSVAYYTATAYVDVSSGVYPGMQVTVTVPQEEAENVVVLREDALSFSADNRAFVYTQDSAGQMVETYVTTGVSNGNYVEIKQGLHSGDLVYVEVKAAADNSVASLLSSLFTQQRVNGTGVTRNNGTNRNSTNNTGTGTTRQNAPGGTQPNWNGGGR